MHVWYVAFSKKRHLADIVIFVLLDVGLVSSDVLELPITWPRVDSADGRDIWADVGWLSVFFNPSAVLISCLLGTCVKMA